MTKEEILPVIDEIIYDYLAEYKFTRESNELDITSQIRRTRAKVANNFFDRKIQLETLEKLEELKEENKKLISKLDHQINVLNYIKGIFIQDTPESHP